MHPSLHLYTVMMVWSAALILFPALISALMPNASTIVPDLGSFSTVITLIETKQPSIAAGKVFEDMTRTMWSMFWNNDKNLWNRACNSTEIALLWDVSVAADDTIYLWDYQKTSLASAAFESYMNSKLNALSASTARDLDIYTDDNAQAVYALLGAYAQHPTPQLLKQLRDIMSFLISQVNPKTGGVTWHYKSPYVLLISTLESALAAIKVFYYVRDTTYLDFAKQCMIWSINNLLDPADHLFWDGVNSDTKVIDKGKLSYTVGVAISTLSLLSRNDKSQDWKGMALELAVRSLGGGKLDSRFFADGHLVDPIKYSSHLFAGLSDLVTVTEPTDSYQADAYVMISHALVRETRYLYDQFATSVINSSGCPTVDGYSSLLEYASFANVFWLASKVVPYI